MFGNTMKIDTNSHENRRKLSNLMRDFLYSAHQNLHEKYPEESPLRPWDDALHWMLVLPELSKFLSDNTATYGSSKEDYEKIMDQAFKSRTWGHGWRHKDYYSYIRNHSHEYGLPKPLSATARLLKLALIVVSSIIIIRFFI